MSIITNNHICLVILLSLELDRETFFIYGDFKNIYSITHCIFVLINTENKLSFILLNFNLKIVLKVLSVHFFIISWMALLNLVEIPQLCGDPVLRPHNSVVTLSSDPTTLWWPCPQTPQLCDYHVLRPHSSVMTISSVPTVLWWSCPQTPQLCDDHVLRPHSSVVTMPSVHVFGQGFIVPSLGSTFSMKKYNFLLWLLHAYRLCCTRCPALLAEVCRASYIKALSNFVAWCPQGVTLGSSESWWLGVTPTTALTAASAGVLPSLLTSPDSHGPQDTEKLSSCRGTDTRTACKFIYIYIQYTHFVQNLFYFYRN